MNAADPNRVRAIVNATPPHLRNQLAAVIEHAASLADRKQNPGGVVPRGDGGNIAAFLAKQDPAIVNVLNQILGAAETPRDRPFVPKETETHKLRSFGFPDSWQDIKDALDTMTVAGKLQVQMGGDVDEPLPEPTARDDMAASLEAHENARRWGEYADRELANAGAEAGLSLRETIGAVGDAKAQTLGYSYDPADDGISTSATSDMKSDIEAAMERVGGGA